jgi:hypothetical protein
MLLLFTEIEQNLLMDNGIDVEKNKDYSEEEALELLEELYDKEAMYANLPLEDPEYKMADIFANLADRLATMIPNN